MRSRVPPAWSTLHTPDMVRSCLRRRRGSIAISRTRPIRIGKCYNQRCPNLATPNQRSAAVSSTAA
eukprot:scaffold120422_cov36-Phaeocystis_antarctica.AAC.1